jgi:hypothetical protein
LITKPNPLYENADLELAIMSDEQTAMGLGPVLRFHNKDLGEVQKALENKNFQKLIDLSIPKMIEVTA